MSQLKESTIERASIASRTNKLSDQVSFLAPGASENKKGEPGPPSPNTKLKKGKENAFA